VALLVWRLENPHTERTLLETSPARILMTLRIVYDCLKIIFLRPPSSHSLQRATVKSQRLSVHSLTFSLTKIREDLRPHKIRITSINYQQSSSMAFFYPFRECFDIKPCFSFKVLLIPLILFTILIECFFSFLIFFICWGEKKRKKKTSHTHLHACKSAIRCS
jgi:hypothetical protein